MLPKIILRLSMLAFSTGICAFSCQDHPVADTPAQIKTQKLTFNQYPNAIFHVEFQTIGTVPILEYGIVYTARSGKTLEINKTPTILDNKIIFTTPALAGSVSHPFVLDESTAEMFYRAYAKLQDGVVLYGDDILQFGLISDVKTKEKFLPVDTEMIVNGIKNLTLTTWNYIGQDSKTKRHYGPMAQDFYKAFGKDSMGRIGNDTTIQQLDINGVTLTAIQALIRRTENLEKANQELVKELNALKKQPALAAGTKNTAGNARLR
jgi:hypothetical protein